MNRRDALALILTDDAQAGAVCQAALRESGLNTEWIRQGRAALERLQQVQPALVIVDVELPGVSGLEILAYVGSQTAARIVLLTADVVCAHLTGVAVDAELLKPVQRADVREVLQVCFS